MERYIWLAAFGVLMSPGIAAAQLESFVRGGASQAQYAKAVGTCDASLLTVTCDEIVKKYSERIKYSFKNYQELGSFLGRLDAKPCEGAPAFTCLFDSKQNNLLVVRLENSNARQQPKQVDHWATKEECLASQHAPFYIPSTTSKDALGKDEVILAHPTGGCFEIELPDRLTKGFPDEGWGWIRVERGRDIVFNKRGKALRIAKCDNRIRNQATFPIPGVSPNPFEVIEETRVEAPDILNQSLAAAERMPVMRHREETHGGPAWYSLKRTSGKLLWGTVAAGVIAGTICAVREGGCVVARATATAIVNQR